MIPRILAVLAAFWLVLAFALATIMPPYTSASEVLDGIDHDRLVALSEWGSRSLPSWLWDHALVPLLLRPAWLIPTGVGLVCLGLAITIGSGKSVARHHRRRS